MIRVNDSRSPKDWHNWRKGEQILFLGSRLMETEQKQEIIIVAPSLLAIFTRCAIFTRHLHSLRHLYSPYLLVAPSLLILVESQEAFLHLSAKQLGIINDVSKQCDDTVQLRIHSTLQQYSLTQGRWTRGVRGVLASLWILSYCKWPWNLAKIEDVKRKI